MITQLKLINLTTDAQLDIPENGDFFTLRTCQRFLVLSLNALPLPGRQFPSGQEEKVFLPEIEHYNGPQAYQFLLEVICGLRSQLPAENEISGQFRQAFSDFSKRLHRNTDLLFILEKMLKDSKEIRHKYLRNIGQQSYAGITRHILNKKAKRQGILLLGSGEMASDLIKLLKKKFQIHISARNQEKTNDLCQEYALIQIPWNNLSAYGQFPAIVNTIGAADTTLLGPDFFAAWMQGTMTCKIFIDLGSPSVIQTPYQKEDGVYRLEDILQEGAILNQEKESQIAQAKAAIREVAQLRMETLSLNYLNRKSKIG
jgi:glutamyl-tRNA reductase